MRRRLVKIDCWKEGVRVIIVDDDWSLEKSDSRLIPSSTCVHISSNAAFNAESIDHH
jgi:hypothetical protein